LSKKKKSNTSCLGLFLKGFVISSLILANLVIAGVMVAIKFFQADPAAWTDFSSFTSHPWLAIYAVFTVATVVGMFLGILGTAISVLFGGDSKKSTPAKKARPMSKRNTTV
jgi:succinate dehydrogenase hydrophobic anchor subunit